VKLRKCAWSAKQEELPKGKTIAERPVWVRRHVVSMACPKSTISGKSLEMLERFTYWKLAGDGSLMREEAKMADALLFLNEQWLEEEKHGETKE
jgi:hypothetical protein